MHPLTNLSDATTAPGPSPAAAALADVIGSLDEDGWRALLPELEALARGVSRRFEDVGGADDALGELALRAWDTWLDEWAAGVRAGTEPRSLRTFLRHRLSSHLRELRRRGARRRRLVAPLARGAVDGDDGALFARPLPRPDEALEADELRAGVSVDEQARALVLLRESGFSQQEIAEALGTSRPTVTRRLAGVAAALAALLTVAAVAWWLWPRSVDGVEIAPEAGVGDRAASDPVIEEDAELPEAEGESAIIWLHTEPEGAVVYDAEGRNLGHTPLAIPRPSAGARVELRLHAPGHVERTVRLNERTFPEVSLTLDRSDSPRSDRLGGR